MKSILRLNDFEWIPCFSSSDAKGKFDYEYKFFFLRDALSISILLLSKSLCKQPRMKFLKNVKLLSFFLKCFSKQSKTKQVIHNSLSQDFVQHVPAYVMFTVNPFISLTFDVAYDVNSF